MLDKELVRAAYNSNHSYAETARLFGVTRQYIYQVLRGNTIGRKGREHLYEAKFGTKCEICKKVPPEHLHHIDGNPQNDVAENLQALCHRCHRNVHVLMKAGLPPTAKRHCRDCGAEITKEKRVGGYGRCIACYSRHKRAHTPTPFYPDRSAA